MPNFKEHDYMGNGAGLIYGLNRVLENPSIHGMVESVGRYCGCKAGIHLPDKIDVPMSPNHRGTAHSLFVIGTGIYTIPEILARVSQICREKVQHHEQIAMLAGDQTTYILNKIAAIFWSFLNGFIAGLPVGYVVHLIQDFLTPKSLPAF